MISLDSFSIFFPPLSLDATHCGVGLAGGGCVGVGEEGAVLVGVGGCGGGCRPGECFQVVEKWVTLFLVSGTITSR